MESSVDTKNIPSDKNYSIMKTSFNKKVCHKIGLLILVVIFIILSYLLYCKFVHPKTIISLDFQSMGLPDITTPDLIMFEHII